MAHVQVAGEDANSLYDAHREWQRHLPRQPGQIGAEIAGLVKGQPIYGHLEVTPYSDFEPVCFYNVDPRFIQYLAEKEFPFELR